jgi:hypothetical protein
VDGEVREGKGQEEPRDWDEEDEELKAEAMLWWLSSMMGSSDEMAVSGDDKLVAKEKRGRTKQTTRCAYLGG